MYLSLFANDIFNAEYINTIIKRGLNWYILNLIPQLFSNIELIADFILLVGAFNQIKKYSFNTGKA